MLKVLNDGALQMQRAPMTLLPVLTILYSRCCLWTLQLLKKGSEAVGQDVFSGASVEDGEVRSGETRLSEPPEEMEPLLGFLDD